MRPGGRKLRQWSVAAWALLAAGSAVALVPTDNTSLLEQKAYRHPDLHVPVVLKSPFVLDSLQQDEALVSLQQLGIAPVDAHLDPIGGRWGGLVLTQPLIPGSGYGNRLQWSDLAISPPQNDEALAQATWLAFTDYLQAHEAQLKIDVNELVQPGNVTIHENGDIIQIYAPREINGVRVRDNHVSAGINRGNLLILGASRWGDIRTSTTPTVPYAAALAILSSHLGELAMNGTWKKPELVLLPMASHSQRAGEGYPYRLAWVINPTLADQHAYWEGLVDAHTGELISFLDTADYGAANTREILGGVLPVSNDGGFLGTEEPNYPMPFADVTHNGTTRFADSGGNLALCLQGTVTTGLNGQFVRMTDTCGSVTGNSATDIDLGISGGTDCTTPGTGGAGNTHSTRTGFYELNRLKEQARGQLPNNNWLKGQLTSNMNIQQACNANFSPATGQINFYRRGSVGGLLCRNTGEIAAIFDHEWGHGMDNNDTVPSTSRPGEAIADIFAVLRLNTSCIGRGFRETTMCTGYGDACTQCSGVREVDWAKHSSGQPHGQAYANACPTTAGSTGPCGLSTHCEGHLIGEAAWDLIKRDFTAAPFNMDDNTAQETAARLFYIGSSPVTDWYTCNTGTDRTDGCAATGGYRNVLLVDDDNGNLLDGTPHMTAIFNAFARHNVACNDPNNPNDPNEPSLPSVAVNSGCVGGPTTATTVTATALDRGASLTWTAVPNAFSYRVYRTDGVQACTFGKILVTETTGLSYIDSGLQNGRQYAYTVVAVGSTDGNVSANQSCRGPMSDCSAASASVVPQVGPNLAADTASVSFDVVSGDGDTAFDNCEQASIGFDVYNTGNGVQNNIRVLSVTTPNDPNALEFFSPFPQTISSSLAACGIGQASIQVRGANLPTNGVLDIIVTYTSDELVALNSPPKEVRVRVIDTESDYNPVSSVTYNYDSNGDLEGWTVVQGTFNQATAGGGSSGPGYARSSSLLDNACDQIRSPIFLLQPNSELTLSTNFAIEPNDGGWWDRANVALFNVQSQTRTTVNPSSGRAYNASGANGGCINNGQAGWGASMTTWAPSTWNSTALNATTNSGKLMQLDVVYSTDTSVVLDGFRFDAVTLSNVSTRGADAQSNTCGALGTPVPTATRTATPTQTATATQTPTRTFTLTRTPTLSPTPSLTRTPSNTRTMTPSQTPSFTSTPVDTDTPTLTPTQSPTSIPTDTPTGVPTDTPTQTPTTGASDTPTPSVTAGAPTNTPTATVTAPTLGQSTSSPTIILSVALLLALLAVRRRQVRG